jgi:hypothetical protein
MYEEFAGVYSDKIRIQELLSQNRLTQEIKSKNKQKDVARAKASQSSSGFANQQQSDTDITTQKEFLPIQNSYCIDSSFRADQQLGIDQNYNTTTNLVLAADT